MAYGLREINKTYKIKYIKPENSDFVIQIDLGRVINKINKIEYKFNNFKIFIRPQVFNKDYLRTAMLSSCISSNLSHFHINFNGCCLGTGHGVVKTLIHTVKPHLLIKFIIDNIIYNINTRSTMIPMGSHLIHGHGYRTKCPQCKKSLLIKSGKIFYYRGNKIVHNKCYKEYMNAKRLKAWDNYSFK